LRHHRENHPLPYLADFVSMSRGQRPSDNLWIEWGVVSGLLDTGKLTPEEQQLLLLVLAKKGSWDKFHYLFNSGIKPSPQSEFIVAQGLSVKREFSSNEELQAEALKALPQRSTRSENLTFSYPLHSKIEYEIQKMCQELKTADVVVSLHDLAMCPIAVNSWKTRGECARRLVYHPRFWHARLQ
jgi:hypothetical protein